MKLFAFKPAKSREGSIIVIVMILLALLTIIGISATKMSTNELKVSSNDKNYKVGFYHAESGVYGVAKWISMIIDTDDNEIPDTGSGTDYNFEYLDTADGSADLDQILSEVMGYSGAYDEEKDIQFDMETSTSAAGDSTVTVDFDRRRATTMAGGTAASLGDGTKSVGTKTLAALPYWITAEAITATKTDIIIIGRYLKMEGLYSGL